MANISKGLAADNAALGYRFVPGRDNCQCSALALPAADACSVFLDIVKKMFHLPFEWVGFSTASQLGELLVGAICFCPIDINT